MIITCENCGKRHHIDPEQLREAMTTFQCDACDHVMTFSIRADNPGDLPTSNAEFIDVAEQNEEATPSNPETAKEEPPESGSPPLTPDDSEDIDWAEVIKEATPSNPETKTEESPESAPLPLTPGNSGDIDWAEVIKEAKLSAPETKGEESPESGLDETWALNPEKPEFIDMAEQKEEATPSIPETKGEESPESGLDETWALNPEKPEFIDMAEQKEEATLPAPETKGEEPPESDLDETWAFNPEEPEHLDVAEQNEEATPSTPETAREESPESGLDETWALNPKEPEHLDWAEQDKEMTSSTPQAAKEEEPPRPALRKREGPVMRGKMFFLFLLIPICLIIAAIFIHRNSMETLTGFIITESSQLVTKMAEHAIAEKGRFVATEVERYVLSHPDLPKENFMQDPVLKGIGIQKVGNTGYTYLISMRTPTEVSALWLHPDEKLIGKDVITVMRKALGDGYKGWNRIQGVAFTQGTEAAGYYMGHDKREKYMVMVPVEGTAFFVASTTYLDEFTKPLIALQGRVNELTAAAARIMTIVLIATALIIVLLFAINSYLLSGRLKNVSVAANDIGVDDLAVEPGRTKWGNESKAAPAFRRMQGGIQHAIQRFRERR